MFPLSNLELKTIEEDAFLGRYSIEPLHPGYGIMIGNSLRRVLLSSIPGAAPIAVRIEGVPHEFSVIEGVVEDVVQIILNLKKLVVAMDTDEIRTLTLDVSGERVITAADIIPDADVSIVNPEIHIAELSSTKSTLRMDILVAKGRGYVPTEKNKRVDYPIGTIWMDAMFTPVKNVKFNVEQTLIEQYLDFEKITLDILCNGAVAPKDALNEAFNILSEYYASVIHPELLRKGEADMDTTLEERLSLSLDVVLPNLPAKINHLLVYAGIKSLRDILMKRKEDLATIHGMTAKSLSEIGKQLEDSSDFSLISQYSFPFLAEIDTESESVKPEPEPEEEMVAIPEPEEVVVHRIEEEKPEKPVKPEKQVKTEKVKVEEPKQEKVKINEVKIEAPVELPYTLKDISLAKSTMQFLEQNGIKNLSALLAKSKNSLEKMPGYKNKMVKEIEKNLDKIGYALAPDEVLADLTPEQRLEAVRTMSFDEFAKKEVVFAKTEIKSAQLAGIKNVGGLLDLGRKGLKGLLKFQIKTIDEIEKRLQKWGLKLKE